MKEIFSYGCIPYKRESFGVLVLMVEHRNGPHWGFPKGKQEEDEEGKVTALRELKEETDLEGTIVDSEPIEIVYEYDEGDERVRKTVRYYLCDVGSGSEAQIQIEEITDFQWLGLDEIIDKATYSSNKEVARKVREHFSR
jgi:8-oxo-dGTP pyrophosphatase MutT (NUDIX family)